MEELDENDVIGAEATSDEGVGEVVNRHRGLVHVIQELVDVHLSGGNLLHGPRLLSKDSEPELAVVVVRHSELVTPGVLLDLFEFDVAVRVAADLLLERALVSLQVVVLHPVLGVVLLGDCNSQFGVVSEHDGDDRVHRHHVLLVDEV